VEWSALLGHGVALFGMYHLTFPWHSKSDNVSPIAIHYRQANQMTTNAKVQKDELDELIIESSDFIQCLLMFMLHVLPKEYAINGFLVFTALSMEGHYSLP
jgi:hypothetical protein